MRLLAPTAVGLLVVAIIGGIVALGPGGVGQRALDYVADPYAERHIERMTEDELNEALRTVAIERARATKAGDRAKQERSAAAFHRLLDRKRDHLTGAAARKAVGITSTPTRPRTITLPPPPPPSRARLASEEVAVDVSGFDPAAVERLRELMHAMVTAARAGDTAERDRLKAEFQRVVEAHRTDTRP